MQQNIDNSTTGWYHGISSIRRWGMTTQVVRKYVISDDRSHGEELRLQPLLDVTDWSDDEIVAICALAIGEVLISETTRVVRVA